MIEQLYQQVILDHYRQPRGRGHLPDPKFMHDGANPLCGDEVVIEFQVDGEIITNIRFSGQGCSISQASASMMAEALTGKTMEEAREFIRQVYALLKGDIEPDLETMGDISALAGVRKFPVRIKCASLAWHVLEDALKGLQATAQSK